MTRPTQHDQRDLVRKARIALSRVITRDNLSRDALAEAVQLLESALASPAQPQVTEETLRNTLADHFARHDIRELDIRMLRNRKLPRSRLPEYCLAALEALESALTARPDGERG